MIKTDKPLLDLLSGKPVHRLPIWMMRQAGRYLPEYREMRSRVSSFLDLCLNPDLATEITLQPIRRFDIDAAIVFADILLVPYALGQSLTFVDHEGPLLNPIRTVQDIQNLSWSIDKLEPVFQTLSRVKEELPADKTLLGFAGSVWTVSCYMIEGKGKNGFAAAEEKVLSDTSFLQKLTEKVMDCTLEYLARQIEAGAEALLLFDSWAGLLDGEAFQRWVVYPTEELVRALKAEYKNVPIIGFPRGASPDNYLAYAEQTGIDALVVDPTIPLDFMQDALLPLMPLHGNIDPALLVKGGAPMKEALDNLLHVLETTRYPAIVSTGHGLLPETPPENVTAFIETVRAWEAHHDENGHSFVQYGGAADS